MDDNRIYKYRYRYIKSNDDVQIFSKPADDEWITFNISTTRSDNMLDLRDRAIETMDDFLTLVNREKEQNRNIQTVILTPNQWETLLAGKDGLTAVSGRIRTLYGYEIVLREVD